MRWWMKAACSYGLAHVPFGQELHFALQRRCGGLRSINAAPQWDNALSFLKEMRRHSGSVEGRHVVELGTGWVPIIPVVLGVSGAIVASYDIRRLARNDIVANCVQAIERRLESFAHAAGVSAHAMRLRLRAIQACHGLEQTMQRLGGQYVAPCDTQHLPYENQRADVVLSNLVLQCVSTQALENVLAETFRVLKPGGCAIHRVCLTSEYAHQDPRRHDLAFLKYSQTAWDRWFNHSIKHLNRVRHPQFLDLFHRTGFEFVAGELQRDEDAVALLPRIGVAEEFRHLSWTDLAVTSFSVVLRRSKQQPCHRNQATLQRECVGTAALYDNSDGASQ